MAEKNFQSGISSLHRTASAFQMGTVRVRRRARFGRLMWHMDQYKNRRSIRGIGTDKRWHCVGSADTLKGLFNEVFGLKIRGTVTGRMSGSMQSGI